ncbi:MAG TPA: DUF4097 family beta strand repeat-containing protein [Thermoanaerobaculia bacterium]
MRKILVALCLFALAAPLVAGRHNHGMSTSIDDDGLVTDCSALRMTFDDRPAVRAEEMLPVGNLRSLNIRAPQNGGIYVIGSTSGGYEVKACKAAAFQEDLNQIRARVSGNAIITDGPAASDWVVYYLVRAPRGATLDLESQNGPISLREVNGTVTANALNGPISLKESSGTFNLETTNGPISLDGGSGTARLNAQNGPITVRLRGSSWNGSIEAHTENGPASLRIPSNFRSGVIVESDGHGPVSCRAAACREARRTWDDEDNRKIELGSGPTVVRMSTVNGPVSVRENDKD